MKKLISAASAMAMAASMVGAAVPFATGAADSTKGVEIRTYLNKDGSTPSTTITADQIAAGDVIIPLGLFYTETTKDTTGMRISFGVSSKDGDASNKYVTFGYDGVDANGNPAKLPYTPNMDYFDEAQKVNDIDIKKLVCFAGTLTSNKLGGVFKSKGTYECSLDVKQDSQNWKNAWGSFVYTGPVSGGYEWTGATSDAFPCYVFDCVFAKGTPAGTYTIDFIDMVPDPKFPSVKSTMASAGGKDYYPSDGLTTKSLTITVEGDKVDPKPTEPSTTPAPTTPAPTTPAPTQGGNQSSGDVMKDFVITGDKVTAKPGETVEINFTVQSGGHKTSTIVADLVTPPAGIKTNMGDLSDETTWDNTNYANADGPFWNKNGNTIIVETRDGSKDPMPVLDGQAIVCAEYTLPADIKPGEYEITFDRFHVVEQGSQSQGDIVEFDCVVIPAVITVEGDTPTPTDAPTTPAPTTPAPTTPAPTTPAPTTPAPTTPAPTTPAPTTGKVLYGDANDNGVVDIADVVVLNKWINKNSDYNMTPQGKLNADCCDPTGGTPDANDSLAIIQSLVHLNNGKALPWTAADLK